MTVGAWYSRPLFFVADVERARDFYVGILGFTEKWNFAEDGKLLVAQVNRAECEIILCSQWPKKNGKGMLFVSLTDADYAALSTELSAKGAPVEEGWWGYRSLIVTDPDGNELYFPEPNDKGGGA